MAPRAATVASGGLPIPLLVGGIVLAFAVGLTAGHFHRRRRATVRRRTAAERPLTPIAPPARRRRSRAPAPVTGPAPKAVPPPPPPPPAPVEPEAPKAVDVAPAPKNAPPPPPKTRRRRPRTVRPPAAPLVPPPTPPAPEPRRATRAVRAPAARVQPPPPDPVQTPPPEPVVKAPQPEPAQTPPEPAVEAPLAKAPERPRAEAPTDAADATAPLAEAPEALQVQPAPEPARRFARATPWPEDARETWTCEIDWKAGYVRSRFRAMAAPPGSGKRAPLGESPAVSWTLMADPDPPTPELAIRVRALMTALEAAGWEHIGRGPRWYAQRFVWRGEGEPQRVAAPEPANAAERAER